MNAIVTVITSNYLWSARTLFTQSLTNGEGMRRFLVVADEIPGDGLPDHIEVFSGKQVMGDDLYAKLSFAYNPFELCNALKPFALSYVCGLENWEAVLYLDSDLYLVSDPFTIYENRPEASVLLTPHQLSPAPSEEVARTEISSLRLGVCNAGMIFLRPGKKAEEFLSWFEERLSRYCLNQQRGLFVDQLWLNLALVLFDGVDLIRHPGLNVGHWNLHERSLSKNKVTGEYLASDQPLSVVHFSNWNPHAPEQVTVLHPEIKADSCWRELAEMYASLLLSEGYDERELHPSVGAFVNGSEVKAWMRSYYYNHYVSENVPEGDPRNHPDFFQTAEARKVKRRAMVTNFLRKCWKAIS